MTVTPSDGKGALIYCPVCRQTSGGLGATRHGRLQACLNCGSLDRHRLMTPVLLSMLRTMPQESVVLDLAPTSTLSDLIAAASPGGYISSDLDLQRTGRVDILIDVARIPLRDHSVGLLICSHVLEHVVDDAAVAVEMARVLQPDGSALILTPRRRGRPTEEDPDASSEMRIERFGQDDHVRIYGDDLEQRLENAGLRVAGLRYSDILSEHFRGLIGNTADGEFWIATTSGDPLAVLETDHVIDVLLEEILVDMDALRAGRDAAAAEAEKWRKHYEWLNNRPMVRMARRVKRLISSDNGSTT